MKKCIQILFLLPLFLAQPASAGFFSWLLGDDDIPEEGLSYEAQIRFNTNQYLIAENSKVLLNKIGNRLVEIEAQVEDNGKSIHILVEAHTDNVGNDKYNKALSQNRANAVVNYLKNNHGFVLEKMTPVGVGSTKPKIVGAAANTKKGRRENRRVRIVVTEVSKIHVDL